MGLVFTMIIKSVAKMLVGLAWCVWVVGFGLLGLGWWVWVDGFGVWLLGPFLFCGLGLFNFLLL